MTLVERLFRPGASSERDVRLDVWQLLGLAVLCIATGIGLRDPWPADEPRFALIARDMVVNGQWLIPQVGGNVYADKPPLYFWIVGAFYWATGSLRAAILLPSFFASVGCVLLVYDLTRRLWDRTTGLAAGWALLATLQFVWQARQGQIDATLCFFATLSLYGLLRHLLVGPAWRWYVIAWAAAGFGVITKGVGFLPLLVLLLYAAARALGWGESRASDERHALRWWLGPVALVAAVSAWLAPMLIAAAADPQLAAYRDEILLGQTIGRYTSAWHHKEPFWYFIVNVIPLLWLPLTALVPWLWPHWRQSWRERDLRVWAPLAWVALVVVFFSLSTGKRGVYVLLAAPAFVLACAPFLRDLAGRRGPRNMLFGIVGAVAAITLAAGVYLLIADEVRRRAVDAYALDVVGPLFAIGVGALIACVVARPARAFAAYCALLVWVLLIVSFWVNPAMNDVRSGAAFIARVEALAPPDRELGIVGYKEQYLLQFTRPVVNFGHARWRELHQEAADAAVWLAADPDRRLLLLDERARPICFAALPAKDLGVVSRLRWSLVSGRGDPECLATGRPEAARRYGPVQRGRR